MVDRYLDKNKDVIQVIDKQTLEIVKTFRPKLGKSIALVGFTQDGRYALVSVREKNGTIIVYDVKTLEEVKRIPMKKPVSKSEVYN